MSNKQLLIKQIYTEQYTLIIDSDMMVVNAKMQSKTQIRWDFSVLKATGNEIEIKLVLLDHILLEANNPLIKEVANLTKAFSRLYNELHLKINQKGNIIEVLNMDIILSKWKQTKAEMEKIAEQEPSIKNAIILNDSIFQDKEKLKEGIQASEFFMLHFNYVYGNDLPFDKKDITKPNFFNSANVQWSCFVNPMQGFPIESQSVSVNIDMKPSMPLEIGFYNRAYGQFANQIDISKLNTTLKETGTYRINPQTGRLIEAILNREEIADKKQLFTKIKYTLISDTEKKIIQEKQKEENKRVSVAQEPIKEESKPEIYKVVDGKELTYEEWKLYEERQWQIYQDKKKNKGFFGL